MPLPGGAGESTPTQRRLSVVGTGYVGLVTALAFAHHGHRVTCVDIIPQRVEMLSRGEAPFYEPGVAEALRHHVDGGRLDATTDTTAAVTSTDATFICVGTPSSEDGSYELDQVRSAAGDIGSALATLDRHHVVVTKSTLSPTANRSVVLPALEGASGQRAPRDFSLACNPEFLREGSALEDALAADRIVLGLMQGDQVARDLLEGLYSTFDRPVLTTSLEAAELIKLASNALLAIKVAYANEVANLAAAVGADGYEVLRGVGMDHRLGPHFLRAGAGFGGSCFPKDLRALVAFSEDLDLPALMPGAALQQNEVQPHRIVDMARSAAGGDLRGKRVAVLGLAFKPDTDDVRETRAIPICRQLLKEGARVVCHDPMAGSGFMALAREEGLRGLELATVLEDALRGTDVAVVQTEWEEYRRMSPRLITDLMRTPCVVDGRRALDPVEMQAAGVVYLGVGHPSGPGEP